MKVCMYISFIFTVIFCACLDDRYSGLRATSDGKTIAVSDRNEIYTGKSYSDVAYTIK